jgi:hypothetical protein
MHILLQEPVVHLSNGHVCQQEFFAAPGDVWSKKEFFS